MIEFKPRPFLYLSAPYTHPDPAVVQDRIQRFCAYAARIEAEGEYHAVSALYNQLLLDRGQSLPSTWEYWESYSLSLLLISKRMTVLTLDGWDKSTGVAGEISMAQKAGIPINYRDA